MSIASLSRFVLRHKLLVVVSWLAIVVAAVALMPTITDRLDEDFSVPDTESNAAIEEITANYANPGTSRPVVPVVTLPAGTTVESPGVREELLALESRIVDAYPTARVASWASTGDAGFVSDDGRTTFALVFLPAYGETTAGLDAVTGALEGATVGGAEVLVTGRSVLDTETEEGGSGVLIETLVGGLGALVVLLFLFGSALAVLPLVIAAVSILTSFLIIGGITTVTDVNFLVQYLVALIGLGVAIDYALLVVTCWRDERLDGNPNELAVQRAMETAGHAVVFSGTTVGIGLLALVAVPVPFFRGIGIGGMVIPLASVLVTITLLPVILATIGPFADRIRLRKARRDDHRGWAAWGSFVVKHRWASAIAGTALLLLLVIPATQLTIGEPRPDSLNGAGNAQAGLEALENSGIDAGVMSPLMILAHGEPDPVIAAMAEVDSVRGAASPVGDAWLANGTSLVVVLPQGDGGGESGRELASRVRDVTGAMDGDPLVAGAPAESADFIDTVYGSFPLMMAAVAVVTYILLVRAFRSLLLPLKALALNVLSVAASYGVLVIIWQWGWGSDLLWGIPSTGSITEWVPIMTFAFLFGLSMDYEVFIMHRMREEYDEVRDTDRAIVRGLAFTGKLVTGAALILFLAFVAMSSTPQTEIKIMATGLAAGIIIDATVIRAFLVPALTSLMGKWNWWLPSWLSWIAPKLPELTPAAPAPAGMSSHRSLVGETVPEQ